MTASEGLSVVCYLTSFSSVWTVIGENLLPLFPSRCPGLGSAGEFPSDVCGDNTPASYAVFLACLLISVPLVPP